MQLLRTTSLVILTYQGLVQALQAVTTCTSTADCGQGEACIAGDSDIISQECVPTPVCGGTAMGNCPSDHNGQLTCLWRPHSECIEGCATLNGNKGIYKCLSLTRCDAYHGGTSCSDGCSVNGKQCNGQGLCNLISYNPDKTPTFSCTCKNGYSGDKCEFRPTSTVAPFADPTEDDDTTRKVSQLRETTFSFDLGNTGNMSSDRSTDLRTNTPTDTSTEKTSTNTTDESELDSAQNNEGPNAGGFPSTVSSANNSAETSSSGNLKGWVIAILVLTEIIVVGTIMVSQHFFHKKQQEQEEEYVNTLASSH